jgi:hypothetical protein
MTDHIKRSLEIQAFLDREKIKVEPDEFAPVVARQIEGGRFKYGGRITVTTKEAIKQPGLWEYACPFYGPGGADNSMKALTVWVVNQYRDWRLARVVWVDGTIQWTVGRSLGAVVFDGKGKTDGEALADLLYKIATEETK